MYCKSCGRQLQREMSQCPYCGRQTDLLSDGNGFWDLVNNSEEKSMEQKVPSQTIIKPAGIPVEEERRDSQSVNTRSVEVESTRAGNDKQKLFYFVLGILLLLVVITAFQCINYYRISKLSKQLTNYIQDTGKGPSIFEAQPSVAPSPYVVMESSGVESSDDIDEEQEISTDDSKEEKNDSALIQEMPDEKENAAGEIAEAPYADQFQPEVQTLTIEPEYDSFDYVTLSARMNNALETAVSNGEAVLNWWVNDGKTTEEDQPLSTYPNYSDQDHSLQIYYLYINAKENPYKFVYYTVEFQGEIYTSEYYHILSDSVVLSKNQNIITAEGSHVYYGIQDADEDIIGYWEYLDEETGDWVHLDSDKTKSYNGDDILQISNIQNWREYRYVMETSESVRIVVTNTISLY